MVSVIVFSLNRAMQLEALLRSASDHLLNANQDVVITVLFGATSEDYAEGYAKLQHELSSHGRIRFIEKHRGAYHLDQALLLRPRNLYRFLKYPYLRDTRVLFDYKERLESIIANSESEFISFLTDDSLFYRPFLLSDHVVDILRSSPSRRSFSLRHGLNIQNAPSGMTKTGDLYSWNMFAKDCDDFWSYNFSIDGHIYSRRAIMNLIKDILYVNPNSFEGFVWDAAHRKRLFGEAYCFRESVLLSFPINMVQTTVQNESLGIDNEMLNRHFLEGYRLRYVHDPSPTRFQQVPIRLEIVRGDHVIDLVQSSQLS